MVSAKKSVWDATKASGNCSSFAEVRVGPTSGLQELWALARSASPHAGSAGPERAGHSKAGNTWMGSEIPFHNLDLLWPSQRLEEGSLENQQKAEEGNDPRSSEAGWLSGEGVVQSQRGIPFFFFSMTE